VYSVSPAGSDSAPCTEAQPCQSFEGARPKLQAGDTLLFRAGTYGGIRIDVDHPLASGSPSAPITIAGAPGARVVLTSGITIALYSGPPLLHVTLRHFVITGGGLGTQGCGWPLQMDCGPHYLTFEDLDVSGNPDSSGVGNGYGASHLTYRQVRSHHHGENRLDHGWYVASPFMLCDQCEGSANAGYGFQAYDSGCPLDDQQQRHCLDGLVVTNSTFADNRGDGGVTLNHGMQMCFSGNTVRNNAGGGVGVSYGRPDHTRLLGNTFDTNGGTAISIGVDVLNTVLGNNTFRGNPRDVDDRGTGTVTQDGPPAGGDCPSPRAPAPAPPPVAVVAPVVRNLRLRTAP
jgi:hypothetical protein